ncbi:Gag polyprotein [Plecturocebus cupreus]
METQSSRETQRRKQTNCTGGKRSGEKRPAGGKAIQDWSNREPQTTHDPFSSLLKQPSGCFLSFALGKASRHERLLWKPCFANSAQSTKMQPKQQPKGEQIDSRRTPPKFSSKSSVLFCGEAPTVLPPSEKEDSSLLPTSALQSSCPLGSPSISSTLSPVASQPLPPRKPPSPTAPSPITSRPQTQPEEAVPLLLLREEPPALGSGQAGLFTVYVPFSTSDLYNRKAQNPPFSKKTQVLTALVESVLQTHQLT